MGRVTADSFLRAAGLLAWAIAGVSFALQGRTPGLTVFAAWLIFAAAFWITTADPAVAKPARLAALLAQSICALVLAPHAGASEGIFLAVVAGQLPFVVGPLRAAAWCLAQTLALPVVLVLAGEWSWVAAAGLAGSFAAFQAFCIAAATLVDREARSRAELSMVNGELLATRSMLAAASRAEERLRIARDLHDSAGHHLAALSLQLEAAVQAGAGPAQPKVEQARAIARLLLAEIRSSVSELREDAPVEFLAGLRRLSASIDVPLIELSLPDSLGIDDPSTATALLHCVQEIITNAVRHSGARKLVIALGRSAGRLRLSARDDGRGTGLLVPGNGLRGLRERVERLGGVLEIESRVGAGFAIEIVLPEAERAA